nr:uncharacterized protein LOC123765238 [Procambarus clarkii]
MRLSVVVTMVVGAVVGDLRPGFNYAYVIPNNPGGATARLGDNPSNQWSHFVDRTGPGYAYGYEFPGQVHYHTKDEEQAVKGTFGYIDPYGSPVVWLYSSNPTDGFRAEVSTGGKPLQPGALSGVSSQLEARLPEVQAESEGVEVGSEEDYSRAIYEKGSLSPLLKQAVAEGDLFSTGKSPSGILGFLVNPKTAEEAGGVSELATRLGALPVAAVHDVQVRPTFKEYRPEDFAPVLNYAEQSKATVYSLDVPNQ